MKRLAAILILFCSLSVFAQMPMMLNPSFRLTSSGSNYIYDIAATHIRGVNIGQYRETSVSDAWWDMQTNWSVLWPIWTKPQIDFAWSNGCNGISLIGDYQVVVSNIISQAQYESNWRQLVEYCASRGMWVLPVYGIPTGTYGQKADGSSNLVLNCAISNAVFFNQFSNILCQDAILEFNSAYHPGDDLYFISNIVAQCQAASPSKKFTCSISTTTEADTEVLLNGTRFDYYDFHAYPANGFYLNLAQISTLRSHGFNKPIFIGENGAKYSIGQTDQYKDFAKVLYNNTMTYPPSNTLGSFLWNGRQAIDVTDTANLYYLQDSNGVTSGWMTNNLRMFLNTTNFPPIPNGMFTFYDTLDVVGGTSFATLASTGVTNGPIDYSHAVTMNGTSGSHIIFADYSISTNFTLSCWMKPTVVPVGVALFSSLNPGGIEVELKENGGIDLLSEDIAVIGSTAAGIYQTNQWSQVGATYDGSGNWAIFTNGVVCASGNNNIPITSQAVRMGDNSTFFGEYYIGAVACVYINTNTVATPNQMLEIYREVQ